MLNFIRNFRSHLWGKIVFAVLAFFLIVSFAVWGIGDIFLSPNRERVVARVGSVKIMSGDFVRAYRDETEQVSKLLGENFDAERGRELGFVRSILNTLIGRALFDNVVSKLDLSIGRDAMRAAVIATPQFQDEFGTFNELIFRRVLRESGFSEETFLRNLKNDLKRRQLIDTVISVPKVPPTLLNSLAAVRKEQRTAESILIATDELAEPPEPKEEVIEKWYRDNADKYRKPQLRSLSYFNVTPKQLLAEIVVAEEDVKEIYAQRKSSFEVAEERNISQILLSDERAAKNAYERLKKGEDFLLVAKEAADLDKRGVSLGWNTKRDLITELAEQTFALEAKELGGPYETPFGWHIMRVEEISPGKTLTFEEKRQELTDELALEEAAEAVYQLMIKVEDALAGGASLDQAAAEVGAEVRRLDGVTVTGADGDGKEINLPPRLFQEAFSLPPQVVSGVIDTGADGFFVQRVEGIEEARAKTFAEAKKEALRDWRSQEKKRLAAAAAERIKQRLVNGEGLRAIASSMRLKVVAYKPFSRFSFVDQEIPPPFTDALFAADVGDAVAIAITEGQMVGVVTDIIPPTEDDKSGLAPIETAVYDSLGADLVSQYQSWLMQKHRVSVDDNAIDEVL